MNPKTLVSVAVLVLFFAVTLIWALRMDGVPMGHEQTKQAVLVHLKLSNTKFGEGDEITIMQEFELKLDRLVDQSNLGVVDGNEIGEGEYVIYIYGPNADRLFELIEPASFPVIQEWMGYQTVWIYFC
jgi:hypothetical protein